MSARISDKRCVAPIGLVSRLIDACSTRGHVRDASSNVRGGASKTVRSQAEPGTESVIRARRRLGPRRGRLNECGK